MNIHVSCHSFAVLLSLVCLLPISAFSADDPAGQLGSHLGSGSVAVIHLRITELPIGEAAPLFSKLIPDDADETDRKIAAITALREEIVAAGIEDIYLVMSMQSLPREPGYAVIPKTERTDADAIRRLIDQSPMARQKIQVADERDVLVVGGESALRAYRSREKANRTEVAAPLAAVSGDPIQIIVVPSADDRRVIEELMPTLPPQIGGGPSTRLTHGLSWAAIGIRGGDGLSARVIVQSRSEALAADMLQIWKSGLASLAELEVVKQAMPNLSDALPVLTPKVAGDQLRLELNDENRGIETLVAALRPPVREARLQAKRVMSMNNLKQIALAMHNFHDRNKRFPAIGTFDAAGRPLLSWRVHLLPYVEQAELYNQFHLDEAWDSPHNKALLANMPPVFACPQSGHAHSKGLATYRLVVGEGTAFPGREGIGIRDITDGTSNTIMAVEVDDEHAVPWTKPEGLPFNEANPREGIGGQFPGGFNAATCDGAVHFIADTLAPEKLRLMLLRNDGEPVDW